MAIGKIAPQWMLIIGVSLLHACAKTKFSSLREGGQQTASVDILDARGTQTYYQTRKPIQISISKEQLASASIINISTLPAGDLLVQAQLSEAAATAASGYVVDQGDALSFQYSTLANAYGDLIGYGERRLSIAIGSAEGDQSTTVLIYRSDFDAFETSWLSPADFTLPGDGLELWSGTVAATPARTDESTLNIGFWSQVND